MKLKISEIDTNFLNDYREIVKLETVINKITGDIPLHFILDRLDGIKKSLREQDHEINFIFIKNDEPIQNVLNRQVLNNIHYFLYGYEVITFRVFYSEFLIDDIFDSFYKNGYFLDSSPPTDEITEGGRKDASRFINEIRDDLSTLDVYLLKSDVYSLIEGISFNDDDIFLIKNFHGLDGDRSDEHKSIKEYEEFEKSEIADAAFELWKKDKENFLERINRINQDQIEISKLTAENEQLKARIAELEAKNLSEPDIPTAESAVKSDEIKQYNHVERNTHLQIIGGLVEILAEKVGKFKHGDKINISAIAQEINKITADYEDQAKERTIRARLTEALKKIGNEHTESP